MSKEGIRTTIRGGREEKKIKAEDYLPFRLISYGLEIYTVIIIPMTLYISMVK